MPELRNRDVATECPFFEFCFRDGAHCLTGKSTLGHCIPGTPESGYEYLDYDWSFQRPPTYYIPMNDPMDRGLTGYDDSDCIPMSDEQKSTRYVRPDVPATFVHEGTFTRDQIWGVYYVPGARNEYYVINIGRADHCMNAWATVNTDCSEDRSPMAWGARIPQIKSWTFAGW